MVPIVEIERSLNNHVTKRPAPMGQISADTLQDLKFGLTLLIPVHNEEKRLERCLKRTQAFCDSQHWDYEIIVVEDGSTDKTVDVARKLISRSSRLRLISNKERLGKGGAIRLGVLAAEKKYVAYMDADLSADPREFQRLFQFIHQYDIVIGSRILRGELPPIERPLVRSFLSHCYSALFRILFREIGVYDPQCGYKLFRSDVAIAIVTQTTTNGFAFDCELLIKASNSGMSIKEVPIIWKHCYGSGVNLLRDIKAMGSDLFLIWYKTKLLKRS